MAEAQFTSGVEELHRMIKEDILVLVEPFDELTKCADLMDKTPSESYVLAVEAYRGALRSRDDHLLRAKAFRAFANCYSDIGLIDKSVEMTKKWQELAQSELEL